MIQTFANLDYGFEKDRNKNIDCEIKDNMHSAFAFDMMRAMFFGNY